METYQQIKIKLSQIIPNTPEGIALRQILFHNQTILPKEEEIIKIITKHLPEVLLKK